MMFRTGCPRGPLFPALLGVTMFFGNAAGALPGRVFAQEAEKKAEGDAASPDPKEAERNRAIELFRSIKWEQGGKGKVDLGTVAEITLPAGYRFTGKEGGRTFEELTENPPSENLLGVLTPADSLDWFIVFEYDEVGYVSDDEKDKIDANAILEVIRKGTEASNAMRRSRGWDEIHNITWANPPAYDQTSHNLVWATTYESGGGKGVNYSTRILGRKGVINANLVTSPETVGADSVKARTLLAGLEYKSGWRYAQYVSGDKVAGYGLTALITGGAAVAAMKTGLFAKLGVVLAKFAKVIIGGIAALAALIFKGKKAKTA